MRWDLYFVVPGEGAGVIRGQSSLCEDSRVSESLERRDLMNLSFPLFFSLYELHHMLPSPPEIPKQRWSHSPLLPWFSVIITASPTVFRVLEDRVISDSLQQCPPQCLVQGEHDKFWTYLRWPDGGVIGGRMEVVDVRMWEMDSGIDGWMNGRRYRWESGWMGGQMG